ncbi:hypothetical protein JZK55_15100 [Dissulfurispira thermophila]|uniref:DUF324 domain-containing protein n=1 Tax=Dissulfurispira thermophila TaxID=2715679 RepID=A0A7G1H1T1_9BACT|nr:hypothetical protein [Dissulfurispira thermophila]BCB96588.1 hypothetical protein JZK55_15100 [Dissulfurispira thermophila]
MQSLKLKVTLRSTVLLSSNAGDPNMVGTLRYIPARVLRGLFANEYIKKNSLKDAHRDERFYNWFISGDIRFTDAFILNEVTDGLLLSHPIPFSVQKEKNGTNIYDLLFEKTEEQTTSAGEYGIIREEYLRKQEIKTSLNFHHSRDREKGSAKEGLIFNYEALDPYQSFGGYITGTDEAIKEFQSIFKNGTYYLGRSRNNQYGKVFIELNSNFKDPAEMDLEDIELEDSKVSLTLLSDAIIYNDCGFSCVDIKVLEQALGCDIEKSFIKTSESEGFVSVWMTRTPSEVSFKAGSTFLIKVGDKEDLRRLYELQKKGIGERTEEGFGRFVIGLQREAKLTEKTDKKEEIKKPSEPLPDIVKEIVQNAIKGHCLMLLKADAIKLAGETNRRGLTPSLIGRLLLILKGAESISKFHKNINDLRKLAKDKLEDSRVYDKSLYDFLLDNDSVDKHLKSEKSNTEKLLSETGIQNLFEDPQFREQCHREFLETFLTLLQKEAKKK